MLNSEEIQHQNKINNAGAKTNHQYSHINAQMKTKNVAVKVVGSSILKKMTMANNSTSGVLLRNLWPSLVLKERSQSNAQVLSLMVLIHHQMARNNASVIRPKLSLIKLSLLLPDNSGKLLLSKRCPIPNSKDKKNMSLKSLEL